MASKIKGLTIEIGGDTTKLGQALEDVNKKSRDLSSELGNINKLLKLDPTNTELLAQKQQVLADAIATTSSKLDTLKEAEKQVQAQFERGEVSVEQVRALQREIIATEGKLNSYENAAKQTADQIDKLGNNSDSAEGNVKELGDEAENTGKDLANAGDKASGFGDNVKSAGELAAKGLAALGSAVGAAVTAMAGATVDAAAYADEILTLSTVTGISTDKLQEFNYASELVDVSLETLTKSMAKNVKSMASAQQGSEAYANAYKKLGVSVTDANGNLRDGETVYWECIDALGQMTNETERDALAMQLFGKSAQELNPLIEAGSEKMQELANEAREVGAVMSGDTLNALGSFDDSLQRLKGSAGAAKNAIGGVLLPELQTLADTGTGLLNTFTTSLNESGGGLDGFIATIEGMSGELSATFALMVEQLLAEVSALAPTMVTVATSLVTTLTTTIISMLPEFVATGIDIIIAMQEGLVSAIPQIVAAVVAMIPQLVQALVTGFPQMAQGALELFMAICDAIPPLLVALIPEIPTIVTTIIDTLIAMAPQLFATAVSLLWEIINSIPEIVMGLFESLPAILETIQNVLSATPEIISAIWDTVKAKTDEWVSKMVAKAQELGQNFVSKANAKLKDLTGKVSTIINDTFEKVKTWAKDMVEKAKETGSEFYNKVVDFIKNLPSKVSSIFRDTINKVKEWTTNMVTTAKLAATNTFNAIVNTLLGLPAAMLSIGGNVVEGVWNGINNKIEWIKAQLRKFKDAVIQALKREFGIASPSKLMRDEIGNYLAEGVAVGISDSDAPTDAVREMRDDILNEAREVNGITLERQLNTTFRSEQTFTMAETGILGRLDSILRAVENGQIIAIDGEALVGATLSNIERKLGQNHILAERGVA